MVSFFGTLVKSDTTSKLTIMSRVSTQSELKTLTNSMEFLTWCSEWPMWPPSRHGKSWVKVGGGGTNGVYNGS
jgi:hypothetical protein